MHNWRHHTPSGMHLKSEGFASNLHAPGPDSTLEHFCNREGLPYAPSGLPISRATLLAYGLHFQKRFVPELEPRCVQAVEAHQSGFVLRLNDGETLSVKRVVMATGISHFAYTPPALAGLPSPYLTHSFEHGSLAHFRGRHVTVIGGGASAVDLAILLRAAGARSLLVARGRVLEWVPPPETNRSIWRQLRAPESDLGFGWKLCLYGMPGLFRYFPRPARRQIVKTCLGPAGAWWIKERLDARVPVMLGSTIDGAYVANGQVRVTLRDVKGRESCVVTDHVIAATGYRVDLARLTFLAEDLRSAIRVFNHMPVLSQTFQSSVPGLYFVGLAAATSFGPSMRFIAGAEYAARTLAKHFS
jgi:thioredoxin reductase